MSEKKSIFQVLNEVPIKEKVERKGNSDYLSWAFAWSLLKQNYPTAQRVVYEDPSTGWNYFTDGRTAWVKVGISIEGLEHIDYLPIMNHRNAAIPIDGITQFDVNRAIQRSTAKAIAMHGLGIQLWTGEDLPDLDAADAIPTPPAGKGAKADKPAPAGKAEEKKAPQGVSTDTGLLDLKEGDDNWDRVVMFATKNKSLGIAAVTNQLSRKYNLSKLVIKKIKEIVEAEDEG